MLVEEAFGPSLFEERIYGMELVLRGVGAKKAALVFEHAAVVIQVNNGSLLGSLFINTSSGAMQSDFRL